MNQQHNTDIINIRKSLTVHNVGFVKLWIISFNSFGVTAVCVNVLIMIPALVLIKDGKHCMLFFVCFELKKRIAFSFQIQVSCFAIIGSMLTIIQSNFMIELFKTLYKSGNSIKCYSHFGVGLSLS